MCLLMAHVHVMCFQKKLERKTLIVSKFTDPYSVSYPASLFLYPTDFDVVAKSRRTLQGIQKAPPNSGDSFWQLEKVKDPLSGKKQDLY